MLLLFDWSLPVKEPVLLFTIILLVMLVAPAIMQRLRVPGIVGLILAGALLGPHGLNVLARSEEVILLGTIGLLYIMFWAGLEIDMISFRKNRHKSLTFGLLTFAIPLIFGILSSHYILGYDWLPSVLLASMFSTHTLISYPIANRLRVTKNEAITVTVGGTIITDVLALLVLAIVSNIATGDMNLMFWIRLGVSLTIFIAIVFGLIPLLARWFFRVVETELTFQYIFVLAMVFLSAFLAELAGIEPIIGAFFAGLALNRLVPHASPLMGRIEFVGNAIFIPIFLISVGMLINLNVFFQGKEAIMVALVLTTVALLTKWIAAWLTQKSFRFSKAQRQLIFGLSSSHAAATIAIILIGYNLNILDVQVLNGTVVLILITCLWSSFTTDVAARKLVLEENEADTNLSKQEQRILVPYSNPNTLTYLIDFALLLKAPNSVEPIYPLSIILDGDASREQVLTNRRLLQPALEHASKESVKLHPVHRVDINPVGGILRTAKELLVTDIVVGWNGRPSTAERFFGTILDNLLEQSQEMIFVSKMIREPLKHQRLLVFTLPNCQYEAGFLEWIQRLGYMVLHLNIPVEIYAVSESATYLQEACRKEKGLTNVKIKIWMDWEEVLNIHRQLNNNDLLLFINARAGCISFDNVLDKLPTYLESTLQNHSFVLLFPNVEYPVNN